MTNVIEASLRRDRSMVPQGTYPTIRIIIKNYYHTDTRCEIYASIETDFKVLLQCYCDMTGLVYGSFQINFLINDRNLIRLLSDCDHRYSLMDLQFRDNQNLLIVPKDAINMCSPIDVIRKEVECPVCLSCCNTIWNSCGHPICRKCAIIQRERNRDFRCSICRSDISDSNLLENRLATRLLHYIIDDY